MPSTEVLSDVIEPAFGCTLGDGGRGASWVRITGELDLSTAPRLAQMLGQAMRRARIVVVDLRGLTRVDTAGVGAIADASYTARRDGRRLVLVRGPSQVERLLALTGALDVVEIVELNAGEPAVLALLQIARRERADPCRELRAPRRVAILVGARQAVATARGRVAEL